jgi:pilus assembly protein CpaF
MSGFGRRTATLAAPAGIVPAAEAAAAAASALARVETDSARTRLRQLCLAEVDPSAVADLPPDRLAVEMSRIVGDIADREKIRLSGAEQRTLAEELAHDMVGFGPLASLLDDDTITDIMVNGYARIFIEQRGKLTLSPVTFRDNAHVATIAQRIATGVGRRVDESSPLVDARLPDGSRVNIVFPPLALDGPCLSIRKFARRRIGFAQLVENGSMCAALARCLEVAARCRLNVLISGGTGSGKTTLLNAMSRLIDHGERVVTVEDAAELQLQQPHVVRLETRPANLEGKGEITQRDLVRNALRMRPDRIIIGECRGGEALDMLQAMNTGHDGSMSTIHANTTRDALTRVENMVLMGAVNLPVRAIRTQIVSALDLIVQVERMRDGRRRVTQLSEVVGLEGEVVIMNDLFAFEYEGEDADGMIRGAYRTSRARPAFASRLAYFGLENAWAEALAAA